MKKLIPFLILFISLSVSAQTTVNNWYACCGATSQSIGVVNGSDSTLLRQFTGSARIAYTSPFGIGPTAYNVMTFPVDTTAASTVLHGTLNLPGTPTATTSQALRVAFFDSTGTILSAPGTGSGFFWKTTGNSGINPAFNYIGTTDLHSLSVRTNAIERMNIDSVGNFYQSKTHANGITTVIAANDNLNGLGLQGTFMGEAASGTGYYITKAGGTPTATIGNLNGNNIKVNNASIRASITGFISLDATDLVTVHSPSNVKILSDSVIDIAVDSTDGAVSIGTVYGHLNIKPNKSMILSLYNDSLASATEEVGFSMYTQGSGNHADHYFFDIVSGKDLSQFSTLRNFCFMQYLYDTVQENGIGIVAQSNGLDFGRALSGSKQITNHVMFIDTFDNVGIGTITPAAKLHIATSDSSLPSFYSGYDNGTGDIVGYLNHTGDNLSFAASNTTTGQSVAFNANGTNGMVEIQASNSFNISIAAFTGNAGDVLTATGTGNATWQAPTAGVSSSAYLTAQTTSPVDVTTFANPATDATYRVGANLTVTALSVNTISVDATYTDETSTPRSFHFQPNIAIAAGSAVTFAPADIRVLASTTITVTVTSTGVGSQTFNAGASIQKLY